MTGKLLIVDDQPGIRMLLHEVFQQEGYQTFQAANGKTALEIVETRSPNVVLLDIKIPGMDGIEILKRIAKMDTKVNVIIMTAYGELDMIQEAMELGAVKYFAKPFDINEVRETVKEYMIQDKE